MGYATVRPVPDRASGASFGPVLAASLMRTDQKPVQNCPGLRPGQFWIAFWSVRIKFAAQTGGSPIRGTEALLRNVKCISARLVPKTSPSKATNMRHGTHEAEHNDSERFWANVGMFRRRSDDDDNYDIAQPSLVGAALLGATCALRVLSITVPTHHKRRRDQRWYILPT